MGKRNKKLEEKKRKRNYTRLNRKMLSRLLKVVPEQSRIPAHFFKMGLVLTMKSTAGNNTRLHNSIQVNHLVEVFDISCLV